MLGLYYPLPCEGGGGGAPLNNNFSDFFPFRYKLFFDHRNLRKDARGDRIKMGWKNHPDLDEIGGEV